jgi:hypothetical protein
VDFRKLMNEPKKPKELLTYKCRKCSETEKYDFELPEHMRLKHYSTQRLRHCYGILDIVSREVQP